jgi:hypothetical protein
MLKAFVTYVNKNHGLIYSMNWLDNSHKVKQVIVQFAKQVTV